MKYYTDKTIYTEELPINSLKQNMKAEEYSKYAYVNITTQAKEDSLATKLILFVRTRDEILNLNFDRFADEVEFKCLRFDVDKDDFTNNYPNIMGTIADYILETYNLTQHEIITQTMPIPLGIIRDENTLYLPYEIYVEPKYKGYFVKNENVNKWYNLPLSTELTLKGIEKHILPNLRYVKQV